MLALILPLLFALPAEGSTQLATDSEARWVPFELTAYNQIRFEVRLNDRIAHAILDTGLSDSIVTARFARTAGLMPDRRERAVAIGGGVEVAWAPTASLAVGGLTRTGGRIGVTASAEDGRFGADVFVGSDIVSCCALDIDYSARRFRFLRSGRLPFTGSRAPLVRARNSGVYLSEAMVSGKRLRPIIVDTGDGASLTLSRAAWLSTGYRGSPLTTTLGWGMGGAVVTETAVVPTLSLAGLPAAEGEVRIESEDGYSARVGAAGRMGTGLLMQYRVLLDPRAGVMVLAPGAPSPVARSTSGLLTEYRAGALTIVHVMRGSPAQAAGFRAGETICAADGRAVSAQVDRDGLVDWTAGAPGRVVRLELCNGEQRMITLRRFY